MQHELEAARDELVAYWAREFFDPIEDQARALNAELGKVAYVVTRRGGQNSDVRSSSCEVRFFNGVMSVSIETAPVPNEHDAIAWGMVDLRTPSRGWIGNLLLLREPAPYGRWLQVDMKIRGIMRQGAEPTRAPGHRFEVVGPGRLVLGQSWAFISGQRRDRNVMGVAEYAEIPLDFNRVVEELFDILTDDGPSQPQPPQRNDRPRFEIRGA